MVAFDEPADVPARARFERVAHVARREGFRIVDEDPSRGRIEVASRARGSCAEDPAHFVVDLYQDGWVRVFPIGCGTREASEHAAMPDAVYRDYVRFVELVRPTAGGES